MIASFQRRYGATPLHLLGHAATFAVSVWAFAQIVGGGSVINYAAWFVGAALLHDLVLLPLYSGMDRALAIAARRRSDVRAAVPWINHVRVPAAIAGVLLLVYFPLILGLSSRNYRNDTGHSLHGYARNWLLITAGLFLVSGLIYAIRRIRTASRP